ncbi:MAG: o-succinylbenzoate--CoA ligase [Deltaproteobacteria bacterium HGW-Deltaproteobacteria-15]|jgi:acyl-CoA synthetase (AMP-forming)/AMP-acid ligase II|nr:MAG: o-succinylbenzoate--CoA ligase [Deltaproteobacteria bacterium HGW-Deltaproteobacteria-15]
MRATTQMGVFQQPARGEIAMPMGDVIRRSAHRFPNKTALVFGETSWTYKELNRRVNGLANSFLQLGLKKGDRVALLAHNGPVYFEVYFACAKSGGIFVPINNLLRRAELLQILNYIGPRYIVFGPEFEEVLGSIRGELKSVETWVCLKEGVSAPILSYDRLVKEGNGEEPGVAIADDDIMSIVLTSGTTGLPKGAMRSHRHIYVNGLTGAAEVGLRASDRTLLVFPFYHVTWEDNLRHILMANTVLIRKEGSFDAAEVLGTISREGITICQLVPTMISSLLQLENSESFDLSKLRLIVYAASPMPVELLKKALKRFQCQFMQLYGQTETGPLTTLLKPEDHVLEGSPEQVARLASAGRPVLSYEIRIVDKEGKDLPTGDVGEIAVRSECMTVGYWNLPKETAKTIRGGWLYTGDYGRLDEEGFVYIVDRKNDMIISGAKNIYPREIEEVLYRHPAVLETTVIGVPDEHWGESVKALVVLREGMEATEQEMIAYCRENLASYKKPRYVEFRKELPKSPTGKILKRVIRDEYWKGRDRRV